MPVKRFTETSVDKMKPHPEKRLEIGDAITPGLSLRITPNGHKSWTSHFRFGGKQMRLSLGTYPAISLKKARALAWDVKRDLDMGINPVKKRKEQIKAQLQEEETTKTVAELSKEYIERDAKPKNRTWKGTQQVFDNHILPAIGFMEVDKVRRRDILKMLEPLARSERPHAANHVLVAVRRMFNWAIEVDELEYNPCTKIKKPVPVVSRDRFFNDDECRRFWLACDKVGYPYGPLCKLLLLLGQRAQEIATLRWQDIDFDEKVIRLSADKVKNKKNHEVPLSDQAIEIIQGLPRFKGGKYLFSTSHGRQAVNGFGKAKAWFKEEFEAEDWRYHDLRRSCATGLARLGVRRDTIRQVLNHSDNSVTAIYDRYGYMPEKRHALDIWARHLQELIEGTGGKDNNIVKLETKS